MGHCLTSDTLIHLADGRIMPISEIRNGQKVCVFNVKDRKTETAKARVMKHGSPEYIYHLRTPFSTIKCSAQHKMFVSSEGKIAEKRASDLKKGDSLVMPKNIGTEIKSAHFRPLYAKRYYSVTDDGGMLIKERIKKLELSRAECAARSGISESYLDHVYQNDRNFREDELDKLLKTISVDFESKYFVPQDTIHGKFVMLPDVSSAGLMQIIGYLLGDGNVKERCIRFKDMDRDVLYAYKDLINKTFNIHSRVAPLPETRAWLLETNSLYLCRWFRENVLSRKNEFLSQLGQLPKSEIAAFLKGIFDAEGCVNLKSHQISIRTTDRHLMRIIQLLLLKFDITSSFCLPKKPREEWNQSYGVSISNRNSFEKFIKSVGFTSEIKMARLHHITAVNRKNGKCMVASDKNLFYQPILEIEQKKSEEKFLFDLEVEHPDASFIANGLVSHNSRWATHGAPSDANAHPHLDCHGNIAVVHNGIIENYLELKKRLLKEGHKFSSETDTEIIAHLIEKFYKGDLEKAVLSAVRLLKGSYAIAVIHKDEPERIIGARCDSPLIVGLGKGENFLASDVPAVLDYTNEVLYLENHEVITITKDGVSVKDLTGRKVHKKPSKIEWDIAQAEKSGFSHFMLKEIFEQPHVLAKILDERLVKGSITFEELKIKESDFKRFKKIAIVACGTAYHAGLTGKYMIEEYAAIPCWVDTSSEFRYRNPLVDKDTLVIIVSQSGETADSLAALREAKKKGATALGICNVLGSSIARESDGVIYTHAGPEIAVASTKAYTAQLAIFYLLTLYLAGIRKALSPSKIGRLIGELKKVPKLMDELISGYKSEYNTLAAYAREFKKYYHEKHNKSYFLYLARNINVPNALEGALKLKEISYISAEGYPAGEMKHGPIALIDENPWVVCIVTKSRTYDKMLSNIQEIKARGGIVIAVVTEGDKEILHYNINYLIEIPKTEELFSPLLVVIPLQLLAYYVAKQFGYDIDQPRNLAKSVTVE
ncbi:MAG: glutamine--fructose-6-phosphate transaminase (isomerizing) [Candidatus Omnitrophota bacterium]